jgi:hypothetical protein
VDADLLSHLALEAPPFLLPITRVTRD